MKLINIVYFIKETDISIVILVLESFVLVLHYVYCILHVWEIKYDWANNKEPIKNRGWTWMLRKGRQSPHGMTLYLKYSYVFF